MAVNNALARCLESLGANILKERYCVKLEVPNEEYDYLETWIDKSMPNATVTRLDPEYNGHVTLLIKREVIHYA